MSDDDASSAHHLEFVAVEVAELAAEYVRARCGQATAAKTKSSPTDVVTHTDMECERLIREELLARCPGSSIVGEEFDDDDGANNVGWIVDPIDGTVNFLYDLPVVSVSIAATVAGDIVAGAVADVLRAETFSTARGTGARRDGSAIGPTPCARLDEALVATGFAYSAELRAAEADILTRLLPACRDIRCMGSAALNLCWVGCGRVDAFYERDLKPYDYAAGALIAEESGARVEAASESNDDLTFAATPGIAGSLRALLD